MLSPVRTETGIAVVARALELARAREGAGDITSKGGRDLVTATDVAVEDAVRSLLGGASAQRASSPSSSVNRWDLRSLSSTVALTYVAAGPVAAYVLCWTSPAHSA